jgi:hypothetical protein
VLVLYLLPPLAYRLHQVAFPVREGVSRLLGPRYVPWWGSHQLQVVFLAAPWLEGLLRVCGLYSAWLRLWGARVGRRVYWTPRVEVGDRALLEIGDDVVFGHRVAMFAHVIAPVRRRPGTPSGPAPGGGEDLTLYVRRIRIGARVFVGAGTGMGPGVRIDEGAYVPLESELFPNSRIGAGRSPSGRPVRPQPPETGDALPSIPVEAGSADEDTDAVGVGPGSGAGVGDGVGVGLGDGDGDGPTDKGPR